MQTLDDRAFILAEDWPYWPLLPIKRYTADGDLECATLCAWSAVQCIRVVKCMYPEFTPEQVASNYVDYADVDALLADGWIVD